MTDTTPLDVIYNAIVWSDAGTVLTVKQAREIGERIMQGFANNGFEVVTRAEGAGIEPAQP